MKKIDVVFAPTRRNFLIGSAAAVALLAASPALAKLDGIIIPSAIEPRFRRVYDIMISCTLTDIPGVNAVTHTIYRDKPDMALFKVALHPMGTMRWVAAPGGEFIFTEDEVLGYEAYPSNSEVQICMYTEDRNKTKYAEVFEWKNDRLVTKSYTPLMSSLQEYTGDAIRDRELYGEDR